MTDRDVHEAFSAVIQDRRFGEAAGRVSRIMRARKRSPLQEAGGEHKHIPGCSDTLQNFLLFPPVIAQAHLGTLAIFCSWPAPTFREMRIAIVASKASRQGTGAAINWLLSCAQIGSSMRWRSGARPI